MGTFKKTQSPSKTRSSSSAIYVKKVKGENFYHNAKAVGVLKMRSGGKPVYDRDGKIIQAAAFQKGEKDAPNGRVQPDRRWFGNTRVITQAALDHFRTSLNNATHDPYSVLLRRNKLPMGFIDDAANPHTQKRSHIVETEPFGETFGPKAQRKKPRLDVSTFEELSMIGASAEHNGTEETGEKNIKSSENLPEASGSGSPIEKTHADHIEPIYFKGTSKRIYGELHKVIDSSDVILHILDARDPLGTLCESVLEFIRKEKAHKQVVLIINKCDLVPNWVTARYIQHLTPRYPTLAFHASPNHSFGKGSLIQLLRQFSQLHSDRKQISVGFIGYPNVGKSSVINTLKSGKVCRVAPVPGETRVWQYITLTRRIYLIDCPGVVPSSAHDTQTSTVLKGVVRVEALPTPSEHIPTLLTRVKPMYLSRTYGIPLPSADDPAQGYDPNELLDKLARMKGRLLKGGEPDIEGVAKIILSDWVRGRIPFFVPPPERPAELNAEKEKKKGKAKAVEESVTVPGVTQKLGSIMQKNSFVGEDLRPLEEADGGAEEDGNVEEDDASSQVDEEEFNGINGDVENEDDELVWEDVFQADDNRGISKENSNHDQLNDDDNDNDGELNGDEERGVNENSQSESEDSSVEIITTDHPHASNEEELLDKNGRRRRHVKEPRKTTNKTKATNFFATANVKNKNRDKTKIAKVMNMNQRKSSQSRGDGRRRKHR